LARRQRFALIASRTRGAALLAEIDDATRVHSPAGLDLGARTPAETAISIYAQILTTRR
jgi:xanthine dehydrogenase accessory factor